MRKALSQPARLSLPFIDPLEPSSLATLRVRRRSRAMLRGSWSQRLLAWSSFMVTSSTQCRLFSTLQCARATWPKRSALSRQTEQVAGGFGAGFGADLAGAHHLADGGQPWPGVLVLQPGDVGRD